VSRQEVVVGGFGDSESEMGFFEEAAEIGKGKSKAKTGFALEGNIDEMGILELGRKVKMVL